MWNMAHVDVSLHNSDKKNLEMILQSSYMSYSLNSLKGFIIGDYIGDFYKGYSGGY